jgi:hypothetical protein
VAVVVGAAPSKMDRRWLEPEHLRLLSRCRQPITVADLASDLELPLGVVRVLIGDLRDKGLARVSTPVPSEFARDEAVLRMVLDELHTL